MHSNKSPMKEWLHFSKTNNKLEIIFNVYFLIFVLENIDFEYCIRKNVILYIGYKYDNMLHDNE